MNRFIRYCLCGGLGVTFDYLLYLTLIYIGLGIQAANAAGYISGTLVSFFLNRQFTFAILDRTARRLILFCSVAGLGLSLSAGLLWIFVEHLSLDPAIGKLGTLPFVLALQFLLNKYVTFSSPDTRVFESNEHKSL